MSQSHHYQHLIDIFEREFFSAFNTRLIRGDGEPVYLPADDTCSYHRIEFAHGYYASALHEISHWCIAGEKRRLQEDYGYWYCADGRDEQQQNAFENVEVKPQALEWAFCLAAGKDFQVSTDNLNGYQPDRLAFHQRVYQQLLRYLEEGFPPRGASFIRALHQYYGTDPLSQEGVFNRLPGELKYAQAI